MKSSKTYVFYENEEKPYYKKRNQFIHTKGQLLFINMHVVFVWFSDPFLAQTKNCICEIQFLNSNAITIFIASELSQIQGVVFIAIYIFFITAHSTLLWIIII